jgi:hypothetical protein
MPVVNLGGTIPEGAAKGTLQDLLDPITVQMELALSDISQRVFGHNPPVPILGRG